MNENSDSHTLKTKIIKPKETLTPKDRSVNAQDIQSIDVKERSFQLKHLTLTALTFGNPNDKPILCLHGYLDNAASFLPVIQASDILTNRYIIALDFAGHGHSDHRSADAHYHFLDYVSDLAELFVMNNWQEIDIVGHSMGAMVASAFAAAFPEYVKSLTLIDAFGFICSPVVQTTKQLRKGLLSRLQPCKEPKYFSESSAVKARMYVSDLNMPCAKTIVQRSLVAVELPEENTLTTSHNKSSMIMNYRWRSDPRLRAISPYRLSIEQGQQLYKDIKCPVLLISGEQGMAMVKTGLKNFSTQLSNLTIRELSGGHHVHMEQAKALLILIKKFYSDNK